VPTRTPNSRKVARGQLASALAAQAVAVPSLAMGGRGDGPLAFMRRVVEVAMEAASGLARKEARGLEKASSTEILLRLAERSARRGGDALGRARGRGLEARKRRGERAGGLLDGASVAELIGMTPAGVHRRYQAHQLLGIRGEARRIGYPGAQFVGGRTLPHLPEVLKLLAAAKVDGWAQLAFLTGSNARLGERTPLAALQEGDLAAVLGAARAFGEHGAA